MNQAISMDESSELTPKEQFHASLYKDPKAMFRGLLLRKLVYLIPSIGLMALWFITRDPAYAIIGYGILLFHTVHGIFLAKRGIETGNRIYAKYDKKIQDKQNPA